MPATAFVRKLAGRGPLHKSRFHDEKANLVTGMESLNLLKSGLMRVSQKWTDRPYVPWIPFHFIRVFEKLLTPNSRILEFGSGRSTIWYAKHAAEVTAVEDNVDWHSSMLKRFAQLGITNVNYRHATGSAYSRPASGGRFDLVVIDGSQRAECMDFARTVVRPGGYIYLDNSDKGMGNSENDVRRAEASMSLAAREWGAEIEFYTGYCPGNLHPHQGALVRRSW